MDNPKIDAMSIVLIGQMNPSVFQPAWLAAENLIKEAEAKEIKIEVIHPEISSLSLDWFKLQVLPNRFLISTTQQPYFEIVRDLVFGIFQLLNFTPLEKMGINRERHFESPNLKEWHALGDLLVPKDRWQGLLDKPGLRSLIIEESSRRDGRPGYVRVKVEPSPTIEQAVFIQVNDHYELPDTQNSAVQMMKVLDDCWVNSISRSNEIIENIINLI